MKLQIEAILTIQNKVYIQAKSLSPGAKFRLSDNCYLGKFPIEKWLDIPRALDENGHQRKDVFVFVLKNSADREQMKVADVLELSDTIAIAVDPFYSISGIVFSFLECGTGRLNIGTLLISPDDNRKWKVIENIIYIKWSQNEKVIKEAEEKFIFLHKLEPIGHSTKPEKGQQLQVIINFNYLTPNCINKPQ